MTRAFTPFHFHRSLRSAAAATVGATIAVLAFAPLARATYPGKNGLIAFAADTGSGYQLYTVRPNGNDLRQVTHLAGDAIQPHWTPDGRRIVFELDHPQGEPLCSLEMINTDGSGLVDLTGARNGCEAAPSVTPNGERIVFERYDDTANVDAIWSMNLAGGDRNQITTGTGSGVTSPEVSPDGNSISFVDFNGEPIGSALFTISLHTDNLLQITPFSSDVAVKQDWAPDGKHSSSPMAVMWPSRASAPTSPPSAPTEPICTTSPTIRVGRSTRSSEATPPTGTGSCSASRATAATVSTGCGPTAAPCTQSSGSRASSRGSLPGDHEPTKHTAKVERSMCEP